jgi:hypothetical protein
MGTATKRGRASAARGLATATRVAGNEEGNGKSGKSDGVGKEEGALGLLANLK